MWRKFGGKELVGRKFLRFIGKISCQPKEELPVGIKIKVTVEVKLEIG